MKAVRKIAILILGFVLFIAGVLKLMDPLGAGLVVEEYLKFLHISFLLPAAGWIAIAFALLEAVLGAMMLTGVWKKTCALISGPLLVFFTILTFVLWIFNPTMDCGCFGEALHLTHAQSLIKNLVLCVLWAGAFLPFRSLEAPKPIKKVSFALAAVSIAVFSIYSYFGIPLVDFTPMRIGTELVKSGDAVYDAPVVMKVYEKDGREGAFYEDRLPDSTWTFVREETYVRDLPLGLEGAQPLSFCNSDWEYCDSLATEGNVAIISVHSPQMLSKSAEEKIAFFTGAAESAGFRVLRLEASEPRPGVYFADRRALMTLNRSNGGFTIVIDGQIVGKWALGRYLGADFESLARRDSSESAMELASKSRLKFQGFLLYCVAVMLLL